MKSLFQRSPACVAILALASVSGTAFAQQPNNCPPGSWFCVKGQASVSGSINVPPLQPVQPAPPVIVQPAPAPVYVQPPAPVYTPAPPPVYYTPPPSQGVIVQQRTVYVQPRPVAVGYVYTAVPARRAVRYEEFALTAKLGSAYVGTYDGYPKGMGSAGLGFRYRTPYIGGELNLDGYAGKDYYGQPRAEGALSANALAFINPESPLQVFFSAGVGLAKASVDQLYADGSRQTADYSYFGVQGGVGLEYRMSPHFALNTEFKGFVRWRTDGDAASRIANPEFIEQTGTSTYRYSNVSGGALWTVGMALYF
ncbi:MAG: outer membrane beta-barrel protein [Polyangiaceae bacterium]|nr:outer membrane beta-barrel protein [Polyangiaceae bacterium]